MFKTFFLFVFIRLVFADSIKAQHIYYKNPTPAVVSQFSDSANRVTVLPVDSNDILQKQFNYVLKFFPTMQVKNIEVRYKEASYIARIKPTLSAIFKAPDQRVYKVFFSTSTRSTLDSVLLKNLGFNSQIALVAHQVSLIEDLSTGGFFNFVAWYLKNLTHKGQKRLYLDAEEKTLEVGLGHQLLAFNEEFKERLAIDNWQNPNGYTNYLKHYKGLPMKNTFVINLINDLPVYMAHPYK